jgi:hypothetical protein
MLSEAEKADRIDALENARLREQVARLLEQRHNLRTALIVIQNRFIDNGMPGHELARVCDEALLSN